MSKICAIIGSRDTPEDICELITAAACWLATEGWTIRSGGAYGADTAARSGWYQAAQSADTFELFRAEDATDEAIAVTGPYHPAWHKCSNYARQLHGRNAMIILGEFLNDPVKFVICWTKDGHDTGGTGQGLRIADTHDIDILNLFYPSERMKIEKRIR